MKAGSGGCPVDAALTPAGVTGVSLGSQTLGARRPLHATPAGVAQCAMPTAYTCLGTHIVFSTKGRVPSVDDGWIGELHAYVAGTMEGFGATVFAVGGTADHVHIAANLPAKLAPAAIIREIKKSTHVWAAARRPGFAWQIGYGAFGFSAAERSRIVGYVKRQADHHKTVSSADELRALLEEHGIAWDERFFD